METFWFFQLQFCYAYDFDFWLPLSQLSHKHSCDSAYDSDSIASETQPLHVTERKEAR